MNLKCFKGLSLLVCSFLLHANPSCGQELDPFQKVEPVSEKFQLFPFGEVLPKGWIKEQIEDNLKGFTGNLDSLVPMLIIEDDIFGENRISKEGEKRELGNLYGGNNWWNSETQGNWWDGYFRSAILVNDKFHLEKIENIVQYLLSTQDEDGYLGIYDKGLRYQFKAENGELWAKTTLLRSLLAWYEYTRDEEVLSAIERAVQNVMENYPVNESQPFLNNTSRYTIGLSHGLTFTDVLDNLYSLTKNEKYRNYSHFLYKDFSEQQLTDDAQYRRISDPTYLLSGHGVHTYELLRPVVLAYYTSGNPMLQIAVKRYLQKIESVTTASGAGIGDEWLKDKKVNATTVGYEYCSIHELMHSYADLLAKSGDPEYGGKVEKIFFNAAQGSRNPGASSIAYLKSDNSYYMNCTLNSTIDTFNTRYKYSPVHQDVAVCCVPMAGRIAPYYVRYMWMKDEEGFVAALLGPSELTTDWKGKKVGIKEITGYPYNNNLIFEVTTKKTSFELKIRKPEWAVNVDVSENYIEKDGYIVINKKWKGIERVSVKFETKVIVNQDLNSEKYFTYGPLVLAHPIDAVEQITKTYPLKGFYDLQYTPVNLQVFDYLDSPIECMNSDKIIFGTSLLNLKTGKPEEIELIPMGRTILRQVTFK